MAKKDSRSPEERVKYLESELAAKERELVSFRQELSKINGQLEKFINQIGEQLKLASHIQRILVPTEIPTIPGFEFSTKFVGSSLSGGDYFDIFELEDKMRFGVLMASSSGHGMASLFLSVLLKLTTQIEARKGMNPDQVIKHMNQEMQVNLKGEDAAHVFYAVVDRRLFDLTYSHSGKILAFLYKYSDDKLVKLDATQAAIMKSKAGQFRQENLSLEPRDKLILVSHGVIRATNSAGESFGENRLFENILENPRSSCHELRNEILFQLKKFSEGKEYPQDVSVVIMEVKDKVIKLRKN